MNACHIFLWEMLGTAMLTLLGCEAVTNVFARLHRRQGAVLEERL